MTKKTQAVQPQQPVVQSSMDDDDKQNLVRSGVHLLDCPFCGGEAEQYYSEFYVAIVTGCSNGECDFKPWCRSAQRKSGAAAWNKRAIQKTNNTVD